MYADHPLCPTKKAEGIVENVDGDLRGWPRDFENVRRHGLGADENDKVTAFGYDAGGQLTRVMKEKIQGEIQCRALRKKRVK